LASSSSRRWIMMDMCPSVLILDSQAAVLPPLHRLLSNRGCRVATYSSPWKAVQDASIEKPDAILTSAGFPGIEGLGIIRLLRKASPRSWIIVMVPIDQCPTLGEAADAGVDAILRKPHQDEEVLRRLHDILEGQPVASTS
jgi:DNA-binding response OmpR family regulator